MAKPPKPSLPEPTAPNVMLPPIDATPEEIARALVRAPLEKAKDKDRAQGES